MEPFRIPVTLLWWRSACPAVLWLLMLAPLEAHAQEVFVMLRWTMPTEHQGMKRYRSWDGTARLQRLGCNTADTLYDAIQGRGFRWSYPLEPMTVRIQERPRGEQWFHTLATMSGLNPGQAMELPLRLRGPGDSTEVLMICRVPNGPWSCNQGGGALKVGVP